ncbi:hypothetical protein MKW94_030040, partial [Papaver nudicaule]|nr:hypothetical protein [Papaver nudicaule]
GEYEFNIDHVRSVIETKFPQMFRRYKYDFRKYGIRGEPRKKASKKRSGVEVEKSEEQDEENDEGELPEPEITPEQWEAAKLKVPDGMHRVIWEEFIENERTADKLKKNKNNSEARKAQKIRHTLGRQSYSNKAYKLGDSDVKVIPEETTNKWLLVNQRKDGSVHPSAVESHSLITQAKEKNKEMGETSTSLVSPVLEDVFGCTRKDGIRGYSSSVSKKHGKIAAIMKSALRIQETLNQIRLNAIESQVGMLVGNLSSVQGQVGSTILNLLKSNGRGTPVDTISPEKGSTSFPGGQKRRLPENEVSASVSRVESTNRAHSGQVELLNNKGKVVALGVIDGHNAIHGRAIKPNERKVYIEEVFEQTSLIWVDLQGDYWVFLSHIPLPTW